MLFSRDARYGLGRERRRREQTRVSSGAGRAREKRCQTWRWADAAREKDFAPSPENG